MIRKKSKKRDAILDFLGNTKEHPSAETIYARLKPGFPDLSLGTVYRNLARFREEGVIVSVANVGGQERYDADTGGHSHFICDRCSRVLDVEADMPLEEMMAAAAGEVRALVTRSSVKFHGLCEECVYKYAQKITEVN